MQAKIEEAAEISFNYHLTKSDYRRGTDEKLETIEKLLDDQKMISL